ncbi:DsrE family protein [Zavarzinia compransoris]|uniref:DsrE family protein n=1 Tax=Zavarzinia marina TaxID=2911065 RepID=UPI001F2CF53E|nr:DsrE family protein [Zavarzinia marina]MCF4165882.1 DsrE family protein [Zavarzinia marina]
MKSLRPGFAAALLVAGAAAFTPLAAAEPATILSIVTSPAPETQAMALVLATASRKAGAEVRILLCDAAGDIALREPPAAATAPLKPRGASPRGLLDGLMAAGVPVEVCALYLPNRDLGPDALAAGVGVARPPAVASTMVDPTVKVISY